MARTGIMGRKMLILALEGRLRAYIMEKSVNLHQQTDLFWNGRQGFSQKLARLPSGIVFRNTLYEDDTYY